MKEIVSLLFLVGVVIANKDKEHIKTFAPEYGIGEHIFTMLQKAQLQTEVQSIPLTNPSISGAPADDVCLSQGCIRIAALITENMNETVDPCHDFYSFACGGYLSRTIVSDTQFTKSILASIKDNLHERMMRVLENAIIANESTTSIMTKTFYKTCMNQSHINEQGVLPLRDILKAMGGWPIIDLEAWDGSTFSVVSGIIASHKLGFLSDSLFSINVDTYDYNSTTRTIMLNLPEFGIDIYSLIEGFNDSDVQAYYHYAINVAEILGASPDKAEEEMKDMILFEINLANISEASTEEQYENNTEQYLTLSIPDLQKMYPSVSWLDFLNKLLSSHVQIGMDEKVVVEYPNIFHNIMNLISSTNNRTLANYMIWRVIQEAAPFLTDEINEHRTNMVTKTEGESDAIPRWKTCVRLVQKKLPYGMGNLYVKAYFPDDSKKQVQMLGQYTINAFSGFLNTTTWMDDATKSKAAEKLKVMQFHLAYPDDPLWDSKVDEYYKNLTLDDQSLLENVMRINKFSLNYEFGLLYQKVNKSDWINQASVATVHASYDNEENILTIPAGLMQGILYEPNFLKFVNFAGIGMGIIQEIIHGFDDEGGYYDAEGNENLWWTPETVQNYYNATSCFIDQYSNYTDPDIGLQLSSHSSEEDMADNGAVKSAYKAYQQWVLDNGHEQSLPGLSYSPNQLFWISFAQKFCSKSIPEYSVKQISEYETPYRFRVIGSLSNSKYFASDFNCPEGSLMNPAQKCIIW